MAVRLPPLNGLRLFEAAARCGSFKQAAHELNLTPGALSHGIDSLETWLDVELFERKSHGIVLTVAGRQYLPYVSEALSMIATGTLRLPSRRFEDQLVQPVRLQGAPAPSAQISSAVPQRDSDGGCPP